MILLIDNYDSFVFNLARYFQRLGHAAQVIRNDVLDVAGVRRLKPQAIVLSPGPCAPPQAGCSLEIVGALHAEIPILGVCLGHQAIAEGLGGRTIHAPEPVHGRSSAVFHDGLGEFAGLANPFMAGRYHSLVADEGSLPPDLQVTARTAEGVVMGLRHRRYPVVGWQFHPESILTDCGFELLRGFLRMAGLEASRTLVPETEFPEPDGWPNGKRSPPWSSAGPWRWGSAPPPTPVTF